jgi:Protein of unknown function (DUF1266)
MTWLYLALAGWIIGSLIRYWGRRRQTPIAASAVSGALIYGFEHRQNWALLLAHPMAQAHSIQQYANPSAPSPSFEEGMALRAGLMHIFGLPNTSNDAHLRSNLPAHLHTHWFRIDLDKLRSTDDPRAALAFAGARLTLAVRAAQVLGWLDDAQGWPLLYQNAQRIHDCFDSWQDYGQAWARGRKQWIAGARADSLGVAFSEVDVLNWLNDPQHPWHSMPWSVPPLFVPIETTW